MSKILNNKEFNNWLKKFLPKPESIKFSSIVNPPIVLDPKDPGIGHLIGLMFHRAWTLNKIAASIDGDKEKKIYTKILLANMQKKAIRLCLIVDMEENTGLQHLQYIV